MRGIDECRPEECYQQAASLAKTEADATGLAKKKRNPIVVTRRRGCGVLGLLAFAERYLIVNGACP